VAAVTIVDRGVLFVGNERVAAWDTRVLSNVERRTGQESEGKQGTHLLSSAEQGTGQESERKPASKGYSRPRLWLWLWSSCCGRVILPPY
jgi:hypothetical protein